MAFGSYSITTTTPTKGGTKNTKEEIAAARKQIGPDGTTEELSAQIKKNREAALAQSTTQQKAVQKEKNSKTSVGVSAAKAAAVEGALEDGTTKKTFWKNVGDSISGTATGAINAANEAAGAAGGALGTLGKYETIVIRNFVGTSQGLSEGINQASSGIAKGIAGVSAEIEGAIQGWKAEMNEVLQPVSTAIGSTAMAAENIVRNPLGAPQLLAQGAVALLDKISPGLANEIEGASKAINAENLANLPGQLLGSVRSLALAADALLSVPFTIISDIYNGLMDIMEEIANLIDSVVSAIFDFFFGPGGLLDSILPISEILSLLEAIGELASFVGGIASLAGGFNVVTNITGQITGAVSNISSILQNPLQLAQSYIPGFGQATGAIGQVTGALRNPEQLLQGLLPPSISGQLQNISNIPGLGFVSNFGTSIGGTLDGLSKGVFTTALDNFAKQAPMLAPLMNQQSPDPAAVNTQEGYNDAWTKDNKTGQDVTNGGHVALADTTQWKVFPESSSGQSEIQAYGITQNPQTGEVSGVVQTVPGFGKDVLGGRRNDVSRPYGITP